MQSEQQQPKRRSKWRRWIRRIAITLFSLVAFLFLAAFIIVYFFGDEIKKYAVDQINKQLNTKIEVRDIKLSLIRKFPNASLEFVDVKCFEVSDAEKKKNLLEAKSVFLQFSVWDILDHNYTFKKLNVSDGKLYLHIDRYGKRNFDILKKKEKQPDKPEAKKDQVFRFKQFTLDRIHIAFENDLSQQEYRGMVQNFSLSGDFSADRHTSKSNGELQIELIRIDGQDIITNKHITYSTRFNVDAQKGLYQVTKGKLNVESLRFEVNGAFQNDSIPFIDLSVKGIDLNIQSFLSLLPADKKTFEKEYKSKGRFYFEATLKGRIGKKIRPQFSVRFGIENGEIEHKPTGLRMFEVNLTGSYTNGKEAGPTTTELAISRFSGRLPQSSISGNFRLFNFHRPEMQFSTQSDVDLHEIFTFFPIPGIEELEGKASVQMHFSGQAGDSEHFTIQDYQRSEMQGEASISGLRLRMEGQKNVFHDCNASFSFVNSDATIKTLKGAIGKTDFSLQGIVRNLPGYLLLPGSLLTVEDAAFHSDNLVLDEWLEVTATEAPKTEKDKTPYLLEIPDHVDFDMKLSVGKLTFRQFTASDIHGRVDIKNRLFGAHDLSFQSCGGSVLVNGVVNGTTPGQLLITATGKFSSINIRELFAEFENFSQKTLEDRNLNGKVDATVEFRCPFSSALEADLNGLYTSADLVITNGELVNYKPLEALSKFVKVEELRQVKFATLHNTIEIKDKTIIIPQMEINSSALNLVLSGTHHFDNTIEYHFNLLLKDLLAQKFRKNRKQDEFGEIVEEEGGARIFLKMTGTADDPIISYDGKGVREKIKEDLKKENRTVKQLLFEEFGLFSKDSTIQKEEVLPKKENKNKVKDEEDFKFE